jgi:hypothetical protein
VLVRDGDVLVARGGGSWKLRRRGNSLMVDATGGSMDEGLFLFRNGAFRRFERMDNGGRLYLTSD